MFLGVGLFSNFSQPFRGEAMREVESDPLESADRVQVLAPWPWGAAQDAWPLLSLLSCQMEGLWSDMLRSSWHIGGAH